MGGVTFQLKKISRGSVSTLKKNFSWGVYMDNGRFKIPLSPPIDQARYVITYHFKLTYWFIYSLGFEYWIGWLFKFDGRTWIGLQVIVIAIVLHRCFTQCHVLCHVFDLCTMCITVFIVVHITHNKDICVFCISV